MKKSRRLDIRDSLGEKKMSSNVFYLNPRIKGTLWILGLPPIFTPPAAFTTLPNANVSSLCPSEHYC